MQDEICVERAELLQEKVTPLQTYLLALFLFIIVVLLVYMFQLSLLSPAGPAIPALQSLAVRLQPVFLFLISWGVAGMVTAGLLWLWLENRWAGIAGSVVLAGLWIWSLVSLLQAGESSTMPSFLRTIPSPLVLILLLFFVLLIVPLVLVGVLYFTAQRTMPVKEGETQTAFKTLLGYALGSYYPHYVVVRDRDEDERLERRCRGSMGAEIAIGPGIIIAPCDHAVAVSDGLKFKGVKGPGVIYTGYFDRPTQVVDLRPQLRGGKFYGMTQDGIRIEVGTFMIFHIDRNGREPHLGDSFPYDQASAERAVFSQRIEPQSDVPGDTKARPWHEAPLLIAEHILQDLLSRHMFDDLYGPYDAGKDPPRQAMGREYGRRMREELDMMGIHLVAAGLSNMVPAEEEVLEERINSWKADWSRKVMLTQAEGQVERMRRVEQARAEAQTELIMALGDKLSELDHIETTVPLNLILYQFLQTLETIAVQPSFRRFIPISTLNDLERLQRQLGEG
jgi:hypothetical protein